MATDRGAVLTIRAAARGVIDFSKARVLDINWWRRSNAILNTMAREDDLIAMRAAFDLQRSLIGNSGLTEKSFKDSQELALAFYKEIQLLAAPWSDKSAGDRVEKMSNSLIDAYKKYVGDPDDPAFREKLRQDLARMDAAAVAPVKEESENDRIDRLLKERDDHYRKAGIRG